MWNPVAGKIPENYTNYTQGVGAAGLESTLAAARAGKRLLLANKEAVVMAGPLLRADQLLITTPMFNLSIPAVLKAWIDHVARQRRDAAVFEFERAVDPPVGGKYVSGQHESL